MNRDQTYEFVNFAKTPISEEFSNCALTAMMDVDSFVEEFILKLNETSIREIKVRGVLSEPNTATRRRKRGRKELAIPYIFPDSKGE